MQAYDVQCDEKSLNKDGFVIPNPEVDTIGILTYSEIVAEILLARPDEYRVGVVQDGDRPGPTVEPYRLAI